MNVLMTAAATAFVATFGVASHAQVVQNFEAGSPSVAPNTFFTHDGSGFLGPGADFVAEGFPAGDVVSSPTLFAGAGGGAAGGATATAEILATGGVGGSQAASLTLTNDGSPDFTFGGVQALLGPVAEPTDFIATADVLAPLGVALQIRVESPFTDSNNGFFLDFVGTGQFETVGGEVSTFAEIGAFDAAVNAQIVIATPIGGAIPVGSSQIIVDNLSFTPVPEPASLALLGLGGLALAGRRRRA